MQDVLRMILYIFVFVAMLYGAYFVSKYISTFSIEYSRSKHMKVIDKLVLAKDKSIAIVKVGERNLLVGITNEGLKLIKEFDDLDIFPMADTDENLHENKKCFAFKDILYKKVKYDD